MEHAACVLIFSYRAAVKPQLTQGWKLFRRRGEARCPRKTRWIWHDLTIQMAIQDGNRRQSHTGRSTSPYASCGSWSSDWMDCLCRRAAWSPVEPSDLYLSGFLFYRIYRTCDYRSNYRTACQPTVVDDRICWRMLENCFTNPIIYISLPLWASMYQDLSW